MKTLGYLMGTHLFFLFLLIRLAGNVFIAPLTDYSLCAVKVNFCKIS